MRLGRVHTKKPNPDLSAEQQYDLHMIEDYKSKKKAGTLKTRPASELWTELDL